jgi:RNA polymerase sigma-70 factor (ECF subfamily)
MSKEYDYETLIEGCKNRDPKFEKEFFRRYQNMFLGICLKYTKDLDTAKDWTQQAMIKVFDKLNQYENKGSFKSWLGRLVSNVAIDNIRGIKIVNPSNEFSFDEIECDEYEEDYFELKLQLIKDVAENLSPAYKKVFTMFYFENMMHKDIAKKLGLSEGTTKTNLMKAKANVSRIVKEQLDKIINE